MNIINPEDAPMDASSRSRTNWRPVLEALKTGKAVELVKGEDFVDEGKARNSVALFLRRNMVNVTVRKDRETGNLFVFRLDDPEGH